MTLLELEHSWFLQHIYIYSLSDSKLKQEGWAKVEQGDVGWGTQSRRRVLMTLQFLTSPPECLWEESHVVLTAQGACNHERACSKRADLQSQPLLLEYC